MFLKSVFPDTAEINADGHLVIGGCTAQALADGYGTPVYVLDERHQHGEQHSRPQQSLHINVEAPKTHPFISFI